MKRTLYIIMACLICLIIAIGLYLRLNPIHIAYMTDTKYLPYMMVSLHSAKVNKTPFSKYIIHVIGKDLKKTDEKKLKSMETFNVKIKIYPAEELNLDFSHLGRFDMFRITLQKLFIAEYLKNVDKVLYLDADTLVQVDLSPVYYQSLQNHYVSAVKDGLMYQHPEHMTEIGLNEKSHYFNSGIMLLNLKKIRTDDMMQRAVIYFNTHEEIFGDQDVLNVIFNGKIKPLSYKYNCNSTFFEEKSLAFLSKFYEEKMPKTPHEVYENASILHFAGHKPWTPYFIHSYLKPLWQHYAKMEK